MDTNPTGLDDVARLQAVRSRVRKLALKNSRFRDAVQGAFAEFNDLADRYVEQESELDSRELQLARDVLAGGHLSDPRTRDNSPCLIVKIIGLCPTALSKQFKHHAPGKLSIELEQEGAAAALAALDRDTVYQARNLPRTKAKAMAQKYSATIKAGTHVDYSWHVVISRPADWEEPANPHSMSRLELERFSDEDFRAIALYRLGGLADVASIRPIVRTAESTGDFVRDFANYASRRHRLPIDDDDWELNLPDLDPSMLPPEFAEEMLEIVKPRPTDPRKTSSPMPKKNVPSETKISIGDPPSADEWFRGNSLPTHVADPVEKELAAPHHRPLANLWAMVMLAQSAEAGILTVRKDFDTKTDTMDPAVFIQNVVFYLRSARDTVLKQTPSAHIAVVNARLDRMIDANGEALDAFMGEQLDRILCDDPSCDKRGKHLLPGPWIQAQSRSQEASMDAHRLASFLGDSVRATGAASGVESKPGETVWVRASEVATLLGLTSATVTRAARESTIIGQQSSGKGTGWVIDAESAVKKWPAESIHLREKIANERIQ